MDTEKDFLREKAVDLLEVIWRGIPNEYKKRYRTSIWQQFEDNIGASTYTSSLGKFVTRLCRKLQASLGRNQMDRETIDTVLNLGKDRELLQLYRDETTRLVLYVRLLQQMRREAWQKLLEDMYEEHEDFDL